MARLTTRKRPAANGASVEDALVEAAADRLRSNSRDCDALAAVGAFFLGRDGSPVLSPWGRVRPDPFSPRGP